MRQPINKLKNAPDVTDSPTALPTVRISELFDRCVVRTCGGRSIRCCLGLWGVSAGDKATAEREALHYWTQYFEDGEYQKHLSNGQADRQPPSETLEAPKP